MRRARGRFINVGRLARYKNVAETIRITDGVREYGHDIHHVVGSSYDLEYRCELKAMAGAAGSIPFVPDYGGQRNIVDRRKVYRTPDEAVGNIDRVLTHPELRRDVRLDPECVEARFGHDRFREEIRMHVQAAINGDATPRRLERSTTMRLEFSRFLQATRPPI